MQIEYSLPERWIALSWDEQSRFSEELRNEVSDQHPAAGFELIAVARLERRDDFLFQNLNAEDDWFVIHLTWRKEACPDFPWTTHFASFSDFRANWKRIWD